MTKLHQSSTNFKLNRIDEGHDTTCSYPWILIYIKCSNYPSHELMDLLNAVRSAQFLSFATPPYSVPLPLTCLHLYHRTPPSTPSIRSDPGHLSGKTLPTLFIQMDVYLFPQTPLTLCFLNPCTSDRPFYCSTTPTQSLHIQPPLLLLPDLPNTVIPSQSKPCTSCLLPLPTSTQTQEQAWPKGKAWAWGPKVLGPK